MKFSTTFLLLASTAAIACAQDIDNEDVKRTNGIINGACKIDALERCDSFPVEECKTAFASTCAPCFEGLDDDEKPSRKCLFECAVANREDLMREDCKRNNTEVVSDEPAEVLLRLKERPTNCKKYIQENCGSVCNGNKRESDECTTCIEGLDSEIIEKHAECLALNPFAVCRNKIKTTCGDCFTNKPETPEEFKNHGQCVSTCIEENKDSLRGCQQAGKGADKVESEECLAKVEELCDTCIDEETGLPTVGCVRECLKENKEELKLAGCKPRHHGEPRNKPDLLKRFKRIMKCFKADLKKISEKCEEALANLDGEPGLQEGDIDALFAGSFSALEEEISVEDNSSTSGAVVSHVALSLLGVVAAFYVA